MLGHVDTINENMIAGWAHDPARPGERLQVQIFIAGRLAGTVVAECFRPDLEAAGLGDGHRAFAFDPRPFINSDAEPVRVAFGPTGATLPNGRSIFSRSRILTTEDWDTVHCAPRPASPVMDRLRQHNSESWPLISVVMPTYNTPLEFLDRAIDSVCGQLYPRWELCLADDCSPDPAVRPHLLERAAADPRFRIVLLDQNTGISGATNAALKLASGQYVAYLDHDDELTPEALAEVALVLLEDPSTDVVYTDSDKCDEMNRLFEPFHKPAWSPVFFLGVMYVGHLLVARTALVRQIGGCDNRYDKVQDYEMMLRLGETTTRIRHLPLITYHWRALPGSLASSANAKSRIDELQAAAVEAHIRRCELPVRAVAHPTLSHRVRLLPARDFASVRISVIIPTKNAAGLIGPCLQSIFTLTSHPNFEVIVMDTGTDEPGALEILRSFPIRVIKDDAPFNFSRVNNIAARQATGNVLVFLNNDTRVQTPDWLEIMLAHLALPSVGAVGPLLKYPNEKVQHAGIVLGFRGTADHVMRHFPVESDGYAGSLSCSREVSAVSAACLMIRKDLYLQVGGMHEAYATIYQDLDLCLKLRERGLAILYAANAILYHHESISRGSRYDFVDREVLLDRWSPLLQAGDPYFNRHFTRNAYDYTLR
jgi:GT2 family glycosyltransferase